MRSTHADTSARMSFSPSRITVHPACFKYASFWRSLRTCFSRLCQYLPSASTTRRDSGNAISTAYGPIAISRTKAMFLISSSLWSAFSRLLVRGHVVATQAPEHRLEQNRKRGTRDGFTPTTLPHISQVICTFGLNSGWSVPVISLRALSAHGFEQYFFPRLTSGCVASNGAPQ